MAMQINEIQKIIEHLEEKQKINPFASGLLDKLKDPNLSQGAKENIIINTIHPEILRKILFVKKEKKQ